MIDGKNFTREHVYLPSLAVRTPRLVGYRFTECVITGPAVVAIQDGTRIDHVTFDLQGSPPESMLIEVPEGRPVIGVLALADTTITECTLSNIAFIGPQSTLDLLRTSMMG